MAGDTKDVTLQIRARDFSQKTLDQVTAALEDLQKAQQAQIDGSKKGEASAAQLEATYKKLEQAAQALAKQGALIQTFNAQSAAFDAAGQKAESLRAKQTELAKAMQSIENPSKAQTKALNDSTKAANAAETAQQRLLDRLNTTTSRLAAFGISADSVAHAQQSIVASISSANQSLEAQQQAIESLDTDLKAHRAELAATAAAELELTRVEQQRSAFENAIAAQREKELAARSGAVEVLRQAAAEAQYAQMLQERAVAEKEAADSASKLAAFDSALANQRERERAVELQLLEDQTKERESLQALGAQLESSASAYQKLAQVKESSAKFTLASDLQDLANPAQAALKTLDGVSASVQTLQERAAAIKGPVKDVSTTLQALTAAQKGAANIGSQIDAYRQQIVVLREARQSYVDARESVNALAASLNQGVASGNVVNQIASAEAKLRSAATAMAQETNSARELRTNLEAIGVSTNNLGDAEARLVATVTGATSATNAYTAAVERYGKARADGSSSLDKFNDGERTTLGFVQRLKGEVLGLAAAYVGVQGAISLAKDTLDAVQKTATISSRLSTVFSGDKNQVAAELDSIRKTADRLGVSYLTAADGASRLLVASKNSTLSLQQTQFIFEGITKYAVQSGLSTDAYSRTLVALEQIIGKGSIGAQDLIQQLGNDLPGAVGFLAKGLGITEATMRKTMETTHLTSNALINMIEEMNKAGQAAGDDSTQALTRASGRLETAKTDFELALAKGGFEDVYIEFIKKLTILLQGDSGKDLANKLSAAFSAVITVLQFLIDHFDTLSAVIEGFVLAKVIEGFLGLVNAIKLADVAIAAYSAKVAAADALMAASAVEGGALSAFAGGIAATTVAAGGLVAILGTMAAAITAGIAAYAIASKVLQATGATDKIGDFGIYDATHAAPSMAGGYVPGTVKGLGANAGKNPPPGVQDPGGGVTAVDLYYEAIKKESDKQQKELDEQSRAARAHSAKEELDQRIAIATEVLQQQKAQAEAQLGTSQQGAVAVARINAQIQEATSTETTKFNTEQAAKAKEHAQQLAQLMQETGEELKNITAANEQKLSSLDPSADFEQRLKARLATVDKQFKQLYDQVSKIRLLSSSDADKVTAGLVAARPAADAAARQEAENDELVRLQTKLNELTADRTSELTAQQALFEAGGQSSQELLTNTKVVNDKFQVSIQKAIDDVRQFAATVQSIQKDPARAAGITSKLDTATANNNSGKQDAQADLNDSETHVNALLSERASLIADINSKKALGLITDQQAADQQNTVNAIFKDEILNAGKLINDYIDTLEKFTSDPTVLAALEAQRQKMQQIQDTTTKNQKVWSDYETSIINGSGEVVTNGLQNIITALVTAKSAHESLGQVAESVATKTALAFAQMIEQATLYIVKLQIIKALQGFGSDGAASGGGAAAGAGSSDLAGTAANVAHGGGIAGMANRSTRIVPAALFARAQRLHTGGMPGIDSTEVPTILKKNEEVITRDDPRHVLNGGKNSVAAQGGGFNQRIVLVDDQRNVHEAMSSSQGEKVTLQTIRRNIPTIRQMINNK